MTTNADVQTAADQPSSSPNRKRIWIAWFCILATTICICGMTYFAAGAAPDQQAGLVGAISELQGKYLVGAASFLPANGDQLSGSVAANAGPVEQRLRNIVLIGDLEGQAAAEQQLIDLAKLVETERAESERTGSEFSVSESDQRSQRILGELYAAGSTQAENVNSLSNEDRAHLATALGWHGQLAQAPPEADEAARAVVVGQARSTFIFTVVSFILALGMGVIGLVSLAIGVAYYMSGRLSPQLTEGHVSSHLYVETFAIWLVLLFVLQIASGLVAAIMPTALRLVPLLVSFFLSLIVLWWPVYCGAKFSDVRRDIGWTSSSMLWPLHGVAGYLMALPLLGVGVMLTAVLTLLLSMGVDARPLDPVSTPSHPIVHQLSKGNPLVIVQVLLLAVIAAPVVEETMFRGVLYRHLRDTSRTLGLGMSILFSVLLNSFIFVIIHPQGIAAIPALMSLAIGFTLAREFLNSLYPSMCMHGISNGITMMIALTLFAN